MNTGHLAITDPQEPARPHSRAAALAIAAGVARRPHPERRTVFALFRLMALAAPSTPPLTGSILVSPTDLLLDSPSADGHPDTASGLLMAGLRTLRLGDLLGGEPDGDDNPLARFPAAPLFDMATVCLTAAPASGCRPDGWLVRAGQWAYWCLTANDRTLLCRLGHAWLAAGNDRVGRIALRLGRRIMEEGGTAGPATVAVPELLALARPEIVPPFMEMSLLALAIEAAVALEEAGVIGGVAYPGPRGSALTAETLLPPYPPNRR
jgi:hypothetical protein